jgi:hypothetical protein
MKGCHYCAVFLLGAAWSERATLFRRDEMNNKAMVALVSVMSFGALVTDAKAGEEAPAKAEKAAKAKPAPKGKAEAKDGKGSKGGDASCGGKKGGEGACSGDKGKGKGK